MEKQNTQNIEKVQCKKCGNKLKVIKIKNTSEEVFYCKKCELYWPKPFEYQVRSTYVRCCHEYEIIKTIKSKSFWLNRDMTIYHCRCKNCGNMFERSMLGW